MKRKRTILAIAMGMAALLLAVFLVSEKLFTEKREESAETMADLALQPIRTAEEEREISEASAEHVQAEALPPAETPEIYALFGVDADEGDVGRSDCILLLSLDGNTLRMCSLARDTLVTLSGEGVEDKLCHAYAYGGAQEALDTINDSFGLHITQYASVNFPQMTELVDLLGGAEVPLTRDEWDCLGFGGPYLGTRRLTGDQALAYCRIRAIDSDDMRTGRQRTLVTALLQEVQSLPRWKLPEVTAAGLRMCRSNIGLGSLLRIGKTLAGRQIRIESLAIPGDTVTAWGGIREDGVWYYVYDLDRAAEAVQAFFMPENTNEA